MKIKEPVYILLMSIALPKAEIDLSLLSNLYTFLYNFSIHFLLWPKIGDIFYGLCLWLTHTDATDMTWA